MATVSSPPSLLDWDEDDVAHFLRSSGCPDLSASLREHGISGEVLVMMESDDLRDVGVTSLGLRLGVLKAVEALKVEQGLSSSHDDFISNYSSPYADGDTSLTSWRLTAGTSPSPTRSRGQAQLSRDLDSIMDLIAEQTERINYLEEVIMSLTGGSITFPPPITGGTPKATASSSQSANLETPLYDHLPAASGAPRSGWLKKQPSFRWASYGRKASKGLSPTLAPSVELDNPDRGTHDSDLGHGGHNQSQQGPRASSPLSGQMRLPPSSFSSTEAISPKTPTNAATLPIPHPATATSVIAGHTSLPVSPSVATEATHAPPHDSTSRSATVHPALASSSTKPIPAADSSPLLPTSTALPPTAPLSTAHARTSTTPSEVSRSGSTLGSAQNPQKFKVTLDDPCWKVLPAALKKYKIQDDWRMYALFICYGSTGPGTGTERCLSYDEKPLLLFQKLKETDQSPVFMLRHIRDIKSPIMLAQTKQVAKLQAQQESSSSAPAKNDALVEASTFGTGSSVSANPHPSARQSMLPTKSNAAGSTVATSSSSLATAVPVLGLGDSGASLEEKMTYAVAIYPYDPEREDEFLVGVDDTFLVLSKAKGWWIVQRDPSGLGATNPDSSLAGWVPAGCLLELARPPAASGGAFGAMAAQHGGVSSGRDKLRLADIVSTSYPGVALMSYTQSGGDEMNLDKDDVMWVFKRYSHWSYAIKESTGERGWVPSWFIGSQPPSAGAPASGSGSAAGDGVPQTPRIVGSPSRRADTATATTAPVDSDGGRLGMF